MSLSAGTVSIGVKSDTKGFGSSLHKSLKGEVAGVGKLIGGGLMAGIGVAIAGLGAVIHTGLGEAMDASKGTAQLAAGIKSTGNAANVSVKGMNDLASSIQGMSGQTDDSIVASEQLLLTFTNIKNSKTDKIFDQATLASANMAAKMGGDASGSAIQLGKALNDPVKGITALSRVGVSFTAAQKESIKAMVKTGDVAGAQKIILKELNTEFGGAAAAAGKSLPGQLEIAKRSFEDLSQGIVEGALPLVLPLLTGISDFVLKTFVPGIGAMVAAFTAGGDDITSSGFAGIMERIGLAARKIADFFTTNVIPVIKGFVSGMSDGSGPGGRFATVIQNIATFVMGSLVPAIREIATKVFPIFRDIIGSVASFFTEKLIPAVMKVYQTVLPALMGLFKSVTKTLQDHKGVVDFVKTAFSILGDLLTSVVLPLLGNLAKFILTVLGPVFRGLITVIEGVVIPGVKLLVGAVLGLIGIIIKSAADAFGWVPGLGPKLKEASKQFNDFRDRTNASLSGIKDKVVNVTISAKTKGNLASTYASQVPHNASGTDNWRGGPTWVNEKGGEIIDLPNGSRVIPADKSAKIMSGGFDYDRMAAAMSRAQIVLDGKNVARSIDQRLAPR